MGHYRIRKDCCHSTRLPVVYFTTLAIHVIVIVQATAFLLLSYFRGAEVYSVNHGDLKFVLHFDCLIPLIIVQLSWFVSAAGTIYSIQRIIPYLMLPHLFTSLLLLFAAVLLTTLTSYHIIKGLRFNCSLMLLLLLPSLYSFGGLYSLYLTLSCFRLLMRKRKSNHIGVFIFAFVVYSIIIYPLDDCINNYTLVERMRSIRKFLEIHSKTMQFLVHEIKNNENLELNKIQETLQSIIATGKSQCGSQCGMYRYIPQKSTIGLRICTID
uniref:Uncharacterized protein n=1 Tax=Elaeophora elaphi TaxID=1147741 RepID=A0A0R3S6K0_9BILA